MKTFIRIGVDLAKNFFQIHAIEREGAPPLIRKFSRAKFREFFSKIAATRVGMEACGSAHYWARELRAMGHDAVIMAPAYTKPSVKRGKNDAVDAGAVCEAMSRPDMRFAPIKSDFGSPSRGRASSAAGADRGGLETGQGEGRSKTADCEGGQGLL